MFGILLIISFRTVGQNTVSPYSIFGIGELNYRGEGRNMGMGNTGIGLRSEFFLNSLNPASLTAIGEKSFGLDLGIDMKFSNLENKYKSVNVLNGNLSWFQFAFPISSRLSAGFSVHPKSNVGYTISTVKYLEGTTYSYPVEYTGSGGLSEASYSMGLKVFKNLSIGATSSVSWGQMERVETDNPRISGVTSIVQTDKINYSGFSIKPGFQFHTQLNKKMNFTVGGIAEFYSPMNSTSEVVIKKETSASSGTISDLTSTGSTIQLPALYGIGTSLGINNKTILAFDITRCDWRNGSIGMSPEKLMVNNSYHLGAEFSPKYNSLQLKPAVKYRIGASYETGYLNFNGLAIRGYTLSLGLSIPLNKVKSSFNISIEAGQYGRTENLLIKETYAKLNCSFNLWEWWFVPNRYD